ncbi:MAG: hypothetical protein HYX92_11845 [Chloroflexi bacterium]|nr:hypothetical protein [Chloroflexota bacterium]
MAVPTSFNPFNAEAPVEEAAKFVGRRDQLIEIVDKRIGGAHPISTILIGGRKIGKTSLLYQIRGRILENRACGADIGIPALVDLNSLTSLCLSAFYEGIVAQIVSSLREFKGLDVSFQKIGGDPYSVFCETILSVWRQCSERIGSPRFVVLIDNAERLLGHGWTSDVVSNLANLINDSSLKSSVALVLAGSRELHNYAMTEERGIGSRLGTAARWSMLEVLTESECADLINAYLGCEVEQQIVEGVYKQSGGHPLVTQYLLQHAWQPCPARITPEAISIACKEFGNEVKVFQWWKDKFKCVDRCVCASLARSPRPITKCEISGFLKGRVELGDIEDALEFLKYTGIVVENDKEFALAGTLFRTWFMRRNRKDNKLVGKSDGQHGFDVKRTVITTSCVVLIFAADIGALTWAAQQVPWYALAPVFVVGVVINVVSVVSVLAMNDMLQQKWAVKIYDSVLRKIPVLGLNIFPRPGRTEPAGKRRQESDEDAV